jgi:hypothetical protein
MKHKYIYMFIIFAVAFQAVRTLAPEASAPRAEQPYSRTIVSR